jgi:hypothetical protein
MPMAMMTRIFMSFHLTASALRPPRRLEPYVPHLLPDATSTAPEPLGGDGEVV